MKLHPEDSTGAQNSTDSSPLNGSVASTWPALPALMARVISSSPSIRLRFASFWSVGIPTALRSGAATNVPLPVTTIPCPLSSTFSRSISVRTASIERSTPAMPIHLPSRCTGARKLVMSSLTVVSTYGSTTVSALRRLGSRYQFQPAKSSGFTGSVNSGSTPSFPPSRYHQTRAVGLRCPRAGFEPAACRCGACRE